MCQTKKYVGFIWTLPWKQSFPFSLSFTNKLHLLIFISAPRAFIMLSPFDGNIIHRVEKSSTTFVFYHVLFKGMYREGHIQNFTSRLSLTERRDAYEFPFLCLLSIMFLNLGVMMQTSFKSCLCCFLFGNHLSPFYIFLSFLLANLLIIYICHKGSFHKVQVVSFRIRKTKTGDGREWEKE